MPKKLFGNRATAEDVSQGIDLKGQVFLVTGCNAGIGLEVSRVLLLRGAFLIACARTVEKAINALQTFGIDNFLPVECELSDPESIKKCIEIVSSKYKLDGIIANAGIVKNYPYSDRAKLHMANGYELHFFVNHIGHFLLITKLLPYLTENGRVVTMSSIMHGFGKIDFNNLKGEKKLAIDYYYANSKLCCVVLAQELNERFKGTNKRAFAVDPGFVETDALIRNTKFERLFFKTFNCILDVKTPSRGAATSVFAAIHPLASAPNTSCLKNCSESKVKAKILPGTGKLLWEESEKIISNYI
jgi:NAD(P)-dependent dehydrogenase (short-subunit alcohol dehydrogenase family)